MYAPNTPKARFVRYAVSYLRSSEGAVKLEELVNEARQDECEYVMSFDGMNVAAMALRESADVVEIGNTFAHIRHFAQ